MNAYRAELRKLTSTRTPYLLVALGALVAVLTAVGADGNDAQEAAKPLWEQQSWLFTSLVSRLLFVVLGIRIVTEEFRYGTLTPSLLAAGSRTRLLTAKVAAAVTGAVVLSAVAQLVLVVSASVFWAQHGHDFSLTGEDALAMAGAVVAAALYGALGVGVGTLVRQPVPATVGAVFWLLFAEEVLRGRLGDVGNALPGTAGMGLMIAPALEQAWHALIGLALAGWAAAAVVAAGVTLRRRDVA